MSISLPLNVPNQPAFGREVFQHEIKTLAEGYAYDDLYTMNTQSGTQWDGFRHFAHMPTGSFYNGVSMAAGLDNNSLIHSDQRHRYYRAIGQFQVLHPPLGRARYRGSWHLARLSWVCAQERHQLRSIRLLSHLVGRAVPVRQRPRCRYPACCSRRRHQDR